MSEEFRQEREGSFEVSGSEDFDFESLDSIDDMVDELRAGGRSVLPLFQELLKREDSAARCEVVNCIISYILDKEKPRQRAATLGWVCGLSVMLDIPAAKLAERFGVSKQAWCALANEACDLLKISPPRSIRSELGREEMSKSHFKRTKSK